MHNEKLDSFYLSFLITFKQLFGREGNEVSLIDFHISAFGLKRKHRIVEIQLLDTHINKEYEEDKLSILDAALKIVDIRKSKSCKLQVLFPQS